MTIEAALWMQNVDYPARLDRALIAAMYDEGVLDLTMFAVSERDAGANFTVDVAAGNAIVAGDDEPNQGNYYAASTAVQNVTVTAAPGSNSRIDLVVLQINDQNAGGASTNNVTVEVVAGTVASSPTAPATPDSAIALATIGPITSSTASITDSLITDVRLVAGRRCKPGTLEWHADGVVPNGWLESGQTYDPGDYPTLFAHIGVTYGGNGSTTFGTPDAAGRVLTAPGGDLGGNAGDTGGNTEHTLTEAQLAQHSHGILPHTHSVPSHTHSMSNHSHSINHDHPSATTGSHGGHQHSYSGTSSSNIQSHGHNSPHQGFMTPGTGGNPDYSVPIGPGYSFSAFSQTAVQSSSHQHTYSGTAATGGSHTHSVNLPNYSGSSGGGGSGNTGSWSGVTGSNTTPTETSSNGSDEAFGIVQPYQVVGVLAIRT